MRYFSMFSGIGGFELGIQQAYESIQRNMGVKSTDEESRQTEFEIQQRWERSTLEEGHSVLSRNEWSRPICVGYSEIDKYAIQIYERHFKHKNYGDATKINPQELPDFDLLVGGFPCQAFSIAGKRGGFDDTRGTLFFDIARILKEKRPRHFILENVKGLLSHDNGRTFKTIISTLAELGYGVEWQVLNSKNFGVPQNRERVFIIGHLGGCCGRQVFPIGQTDTSVTKTSELPEQISNTLRTNYSNGKSNEVYVGEIHQLNQPTHSNDRVYGADGISPTLNTMQGGNRQPFMAIKYGQNNPDRNGNTSPDMFTLKTGGANAGITDGMRIRRLTPTECERLQSYPDGWTEGVSDTQRYKTLGNGLTVNVVQELITRLLINPK